MKKQLSLVLSLLMLLGFIQIHGQTITQLADMPERVSNQAVAYAEINGNGFVYSFSGIDETKLFSGIHKRAFKYDILNDTWSTLPDLPSGNGRIAASASLVQDKIYIMGGYEVFADGSEISVDLVHVFDPANDTYMADATPIPIPIDDHIQAVWRDSLIYLVTGWSNTTNVPDVQIFNPANNSWAVGTPVPNNNTYKVFGSSGTIIGDTIYYSGGVRIVGGGFSSSNVIRKGVINPDNPTEIEWSHRTSFDAIGYRMGAAVWNNTRPVWIGGSEDAYNFDGISFIFGTGVEPYERILELRPETDQLEETPFSLPIMDIREVAQVNPTSVVICGGMAPGQSVSNSVYSIDLNIVGTKSVVPEPEVKIYPQPALDIIYIENGLEKNYKIIDSTGRVLQTGIYSQNGISIKNLSSGFYILSLDTVNKTFLKH